MTFAPVELRDARSLLIEKLDMHPGTSDYPGDLDPNEVGIVGDTAHAKTGTSYHLGADQLRDDAYSVRTARDRAGLTDAASAVDVGEFRVTTPLGTFTHRDLAKWSVKQCQANHPDTRDIREIIYSPDGVRVFRYDRERGYASAPTERIPADNHRWHNHYSQYRDATKAGRRNMYAHFARWLAEIGLGDDMTPEETFAAVWRTDKIRNPYGDSATNPSIWAETALFNIGGQTEKSAGKLDQILAMLSSIQPGGLTADDVRGIVREELDKTKLTGG